MQSSRRCWRSSRARGRRAACPDRLRLRLRSRGRTARRRRTPAAAASRRRSRCPWWRAALLEARVRCGRCVEGRHRRRLWRTSCAQAASRCPAARSPLWFPPTDRRLSRTPPAQRRAAPGLRGSRPGALAQPPRLRSRALERPRTPLDHVVPLGARRPPVAAVLARVVRGRASSSFRSRHLRALPRSRRLRPSDSGARARCHRSGSAEPARPRAASS